MLVPEELNVDIRAEANVVGEVQPRMIGVVIEHDVIPVPQPVATVRVILRRHAEEGALKGEPPVVAPF